MKKRNQIQILAASFLAVLNFSCGGGKAEESAIAKNITLTISSSATVLPNKLSDVLEQTCVSGGITGPRVRLRASIKWNGTGKLLPLLIRLTTQTDSRLLGVVTGTLSPGGAYETVSPVFGSTVDYIPNDNTTYSSASCFLDFGGLPKTTTTLTGTTQYSIPAVVTILGVVRDSNEDDTPFTKEVQTNLIYVAGSVPPS